MQTCSPNRPRRPPARRRPGSPARLRPKLRSKLRGKNSERLPAWARGRMSRRSENRPKTPGISGNLRESPGISGKLENPINDDALISEAR